MLAADPRPGTRPLDETVLGAVGIELVEATPHRVVVRMRAPDAGALPHGAAGVGAATLLAETAASIGAGLAAGPDHRAFGTEINTSGFGPATAGTLEAVAAPLATGQALQVWGVDVTCDGRPFARSRCTLSIRRA